MKLLILFFSAGMVFTLVKPKKVHAQQASSNTYFEASQLFDQQKFEEAYPLFKELHINNPDAYTYFSRAADCLINLKRYDEAVTFVQQTLSQTDYQHKATIKLGEIYHISGDTAKAYNIWNKLVDSGPLPLETYVFLSEIMRDRRDFQQAISLYQKAKKQFRSSTLLAAELADTYMQAGEYEKAIKAYLSVLKDSPGRINYVQTKLFQLRDDRLYDAAILEIDDFLGDLPNTHPSKNILQQLELWLLLERGLGERALANAKRYEQENDRPTYLLYSLASRLLSAEKFELAAQAYGYYLNDDNRSLRTQSKEQLANVYIRQADYLTDYNLAFNSRRDSLYKKTYATLQSLLKEAPNYANKTRVMVALAELSLDHLHQPEKALKFAQKIRAIHDSSYTSKQLYLQGRIELYKGDYGRARIYFSRSNKLERIGSLAEKTRYYLALTDFYAGDYEFADIQLNALERQNTSYFANDAVKLRLWIQEGLNADSTGQALKPYAAAIEDYSQGQTQQAFSTLKTMIDSSASTSLHDEALLEMSSHVMPSLIEPIYILLSNYIEQQGAASPLHERLLWERARIADQALNNPRINPDELPSSSGELITLYENVLLAYPQGFYASYARKRIQELQQKPS